MAHEHPRTPGGRLYLIRLACGDGVRTPESMALFADRVKEKTGRWYDPSTLSLLERDRQGWRLIDARAFAAVDPKGRGAAWLSALDVPEEFIVEKPSKPQPSPPSPKIQKYIGQPVGTTKRQYDEQKAAPAKKVAEGGKKRR